MRNAGELDLAFWVHCTGLGQQNTHAPVGMWGANPASTAYARICMSKVLNGAPAMIGVMEMGCVVDADLTVIALEAEIVSLSKIRPANIYIFTTRASTFGASRSAPPSHDTFRRQHLATCRRRARRNCRAHRWGCPTPRGDVLPPHSRSPSHGRCRPSHTPSRVLVHVSLRRA
jgi:hypothetical protein